jgi:general secretion pathway protein C
MLQVRHTPSKSWAPAVCALGLGALAAYGAVSWFLQIQSLSGSASLAPVAQTINGSTALAVDTGRVAQALGAPVASVASDVASGNVANTAHQWNLLGVVAGASGKGSALLSVDGQAPKAFLPGQSVAPGWVLHSVGHRLARLAPEGQDTASVTLELPKLGQ